MSTRFTQHDVDAFNARRNYRFPQMGDHDSGAHFNESELHQLILDNCRVRGFRVLHARMDRPATCGVGTPDFVIALPGGRTLWVEAKARKGKLTSEQQAWMAALRVLGHRALVVRSFEEFITAVQMHEE